MFTAPIANTITNTFMAQIAITIIIILRKRRSAIRCAMSVVTILVRAVAVKNSKNVMAVEVGSGANHEHRSETGTLWRIVEGD